MSLPITTFIEAARQNAAEVADLVVEKQLAYGPKNIMNGPVSPQLGIIVRLSDKLNRLQHLLSEGKNPDWETLEDTWEDIMGYGLIGLMVQRGQFEFPMEADGE